VRGACGQAPRRRLKGWCLTRLGSQQNYLNRTDAGGACPSTPHINQTLSIPTPRTGCHNQARPGQARPRIPHQPTNPARVGVLQIRWWSISNPASEKPRATRKLKKKKIKKKQTGRTCESASGEKPYRSHPNAPRTTHRRASRFRSSITPQGITKAPREIARADPSPTHTASPPPPASRKDNNTRGPWSQHLIPPTAANPPATRPRPQAHTRHHSATPPREAECPSGADSD